MSHYIDVRVTENAWLIFISGRSRVMYQSFTHS